MAARLVALPATPDPAFRRALAHLWTAGDAALPLDPRLPAPALEALLAALRPAALRRAGGEERLPGAAAVPAGTALVVATSGTTGAPKGVVLSHAALEAGARRAVERLGDLAGGGWASPLPLHHVAGLQVLRRAEVAGTDAVVLPDADPAVLLEVGRGRVVPLVPTLLHRLVDAGAPIERFRAVLLGGAKADPAVLARARERVPVVETYGATETCGGCVYDGVPLRGVEARLDDDGRIALRGPVLATAYRGADSGPVTDADGWFTTGDRGAWRGGRLEVLGRADAVIVTGGVNVAPEAVEALLERHPDVAEAAVVGRPDPEWGQRVVAVCVPADPTHPPTLAALRAHVEQRAPRAWAPRDLELVAALPRTPLGKVARSRL